MRLTFPYLLLFVLFFGLFACNEPKKHPVKNQKVAEVYKPVMLFGFNSDKYIVTRDTIQKNETLGMILDRHHVDYPTIHKIVTSIKDSFDIRKLQVGKPYTLLSKKDSTQKAQVFIYESSPVQYSVIDFKDSVVSVKNKKKPTKIRLQTASGIIRNSLFETLEEQGISPLLALDLSDIYAWTIDFYRIYKGDRFKVIYEQTYLNDTVPIGIGKIHAAYFEHNHVPFYAFNFVADSLHGYDEYFDEKSRNLRKAFLKSPIKFGRISSRYSMSRYVRIYGRRKPHLGTDFAAPVGTPIMTTANGVVVKSSYTRGNGNYVKVKHNSIYSTQYLHMQKRAVKVGDVVKQGQVIGYIGMTGHTTGPHVCYRFWKNGKQVDALHEKLPDAKPMPDSIKIRYFEFIKPLKRKLDSIPYPAENKIDILVDSLQSPESTIQNI